MQVQKIDLQPCRVGDFPAECGTLPEFEDRASKSGRKIDLQLAVIRVRSDRPAPDPIFVLSGGPGTSAREWANYYMQLLAQANQQRDVVLVDQRGTGGSNKLECPQPLDPDLQVDALRNCLASLNGDPRAYTTAWAMDDLDDVRTAALDGATLLEVPIFERWPITSQKALELVFARCEADATCHSAFPNLRQEFTGVLVRLDRASVAMPINNPVSGHPFILTAEAFKTSIHGALTSTPTAAVVPQYIHRAGWLRSGRG